MEDSSKRALVQIGAAEIQKIEYRGQQVVTFAMIDKVHGRPKDTAKRSFDENRDRFVSGEDYFELGRDEIRTNLPDGVFSKYAPKAHLITKRGYLKIAKTLGDDKAWEVFDEMIERYFAAENTVAPVRVHVAGAEKIAVAREGRLQFKMFRSVAKDIGLKGNQAVLSANRATKMTTGFDVMGALGITHIDAEVNQPDITPTTIAERLNIGGARSANQMLVLHGYQQPLRDGKGRLYYELTPKGERAGGIFKDTEKKTGHGVPVKQLMWASRIVDLLRVDMQREAA